MKIELKALTRSTTILWKNLGAVRADGFLLPGDEHHEKIFEKEAVDYIREMDSGVYSKGLIVDQFPKSLQQYFPIVVARELVDEGVYDKSGKLAKGWHLLTHLGENLYALILVQQDSGAHCFVNAYYTGIMELGDCWVQGPDPLGPIAICNREKVDCAKGSKLMAGDVLALVWPLDLSKYKED